MPAEIENLDREAAMMLYLAGELEPAERAAFEGRLMAEPELAAEVAQLQAAQQSVAAGIAQLDAQTRLPTSEAVAVRRVSRSITNWLAGRRVASVPPVRNGFALPWWGYPAAIAASLIVGFLVWSSRQEVPPMEPTAEAKRELGAMEAEQAELAEWLTTSLDVTADASMDYGMDRFLTSGRTDELNAVYNSPLPEENSQ